MIFFKKTLVLDKKNVDIKNNNNTIKMINGNINVIKNNGNIELINGSINITKNNGNVSCLVGNINIYNIEKGFINSKPIKKITLGNNASVNIYNKENNPSDFWYVEYKNGKVKINGDLEIDISKIYDKDGSFYNFNKTLNKNKLDSYNIYIKKGFLFSNKVEIKCFIGFSAKIVVDESLLTIYPEN